MKPEEDKFYESRHVRFNEKLVYGDLNNKNSIKDVNEVEMINKDTWFIKFDDEKTDELTKTDGEIKRKRGRPKKIQNAQINQNLNENSGENNIGENLIDTSFATLKVEEEYKINTLFTEYVDRENPVNDTVLHALLADIDQIPVDYEQAINSKEKVQWLEAVDEELKINVQKQCLGNNKSSRRTY